MLNDPNNNNAGPVICIDTSFDTPFDDLSESELAIRGRNISLTYGSGNNSNYVLNNLSISVPAAKIYGLLGPSGCGKTSLLRIISGLMRPDSGLVKIFGYRPGKRE